MPFTTTLANIEQHRQSIQVKDLPQTFQDAITTTRLLGIRYLWIDALAIIQDDPSDWAEQASLMASIYQQAYVTIAVHTAENASHGFLWPFSSLNSKPIAPSSTGDLLQDAQIIPLADLARRGSTIQSRAWITQELSLSQRILHFYHDRLGWQCAHPSCLEREITPSPFNLMELFARRSDHVSDGWLSFVTMYSATQMTKASDKLAAVAGIAQAWPRTSSSSKEKEKGEEMRVAPRYHCGIFDDDLALSLAWMRAHGGAELTVAKSERAPRWSWASVDGRIAGPDFFPTLLGDGLLRDVEFECRSCKRGSTGPHLTCVQCWLKCTARVVHARDVSLQQPDVWLSDIMRAGVEVPEVRKVLSSGDTGLRRRVLVWPRLDCGGLRGGNASELHHIVLGRHGSKPRYWVLIAQQMAKEAMIFYSRIGVGVALLHDDDDEVFEELTREEDVKLI